MEPHNTALYLPSGKGILYIATWSGSTPPTDPGDYTEIGNCPSVEVEPLVETRPHYSSRANLRYRDLNPVIQTEYAITFECDEFAAVNLQKFFLGSLNTGTYVISGLQSADATYALKFISNNPIGPDYEMRFWKVTLRPNGPLQVIGDDYLVMSFTGEGLEDSTNHSTSPYFNIKYITTTTTTSTTTTTA